MSAEQPKLSDLLLAVTKTAKYNEARVAFDLQPIGRKADK